MLKILAQAVAHKKAHAQSKSERKKSGPGKLPPPSKKR